MHLIDIERVMQEVARCLRPGRRFLVAQDERTERTPLDPIMGALQAALRPGHFEKLSDRILRHAESAGLSLADRVIGRPQPFRVIPARTADRIEARSFSWLWDVDDDRWESIVVPAIDAMRALPDPTEPIITEGRAEIFVFQR